MYERFYQLTTNPFRLAPDPNFCFSHSGYKRAREYLEYALDQGEGFVMVTGRPGTGKTLLLETFLKEIDTSNVAARRIAVSNYAGDDLLRAVAYAYDIDAAELDKATLRHRIHQYFIKQEQAGRRVLLIIDEAQALQHTALEELRILADLQTQSRLMLQLFLVGQESLQELMHSPDMEQFQQRVIANYHLVPLGLVEARAYIEYRLLLTGWNGDPEFTSAAVLAIFLLSKGVPRHINKICNRLLLLGFGKGCHVFDAEDVQTISAEMREEHLTPMESKRARFTNAESITSIPEIRDGLISIDDLAIRADKVDADASAISEASRRTARMKEQFVDRHHDDPAAWNAQHTSPADPIAKPLAERYISRFSWRETLVATAAMLAITTISIAALPSILGETAGKNRLSQADHLPRETQDTTAGGLPVSPDNELTSGQVVATVNTGPVQFRIPADAADEDVVIPDRGEDVVPVADAGVADTALPEDAIDMPADISTVSWADNPDEMQLPENDLQVVAAEMPELAETVNEYSPPSAGNIERNDLPQEQQQAAVTGSVQTARVSWTDNTEDTRLLENEPQVAVAELPEHDETIAGYTSSAAGKIERNLLPQEGQQAAVTEQMQTVPVAEPGEPGHEETIEQLLSKGQRSLDDFRLTTPEEDNAYGYYRAVLLLDPGNEEANEGIDEIVDRYITLVRKAANKYENNRAKRYVTRGLSIQPANRELLALQDSIDRAIQSASDGRVTVARRVPESQGTVSAREQATQDSIIQGIRTFFKKRQAEGRSGVVYTPIGWDG